MPRLPLLVAALLAAAWLGGCAAPAPILVEQGDDGALIVRSELAVEEAHEAARGVAEALELGISDAPDSHRRRPAFYLSNAETAAGPMVASRLRIEVRGSGAGSRVEVLALDQGSNPLQHEVADWIAMRLRALDQQARGTEVRVQSGRTTSF